MEEIKKSSVWDLIGKSYCGVTIDDTPELRWWLDLAERGTNGLCFEKQLIFLTSVIGSELRNAKSLSHDPQISELQQKMYHDLVWKSSDFPNLSNALKMKAACCRYYHTLFYVLAAHLKLGRAVVLYGKMIPGMNFGYTWVVVEDPTGKDVIIDIYEQTARFDEDYYEDSSGKYHNGFPFAGYTNKNDNFQFILFEEV